MGPVLIPTGLFFLCDHVLQKVFVAATEAMGAVLATSGRYVNAWVRQRERQRGAATALVEVCKRYGINAEGVTLAEGQNKPDEYLCREAVRQIRASYLCQEEK